MGGWGGEEELGDKDKGSEINCMKKYFQLKNLHLGLLGILQVPSQLILLG